MKTDKLTRELRKIEKEIDNYYKFNPLANLPLATAAWSLLSFAENRMLEEYSNQISSQDIGIIVDNLLYELRYPMQWLYFACEHSGKISSAHNHEVERLQDDRASRDLLKLGKKYQSFVSAYTYASHGWIDLELKGSTIQPTWNFLTGIEYEAYNRLIKPQKSQQSLSSVDFDYLPLLRNAILQSLKVQGSRFRYKLNPRMVSDTIKAYSRPLLDEAFSLPSDWQFTRYTLGDFRKVFEAISAIAFIHTQARRMAFDRECLGYDDSIYAPTCHELLNRVVRYSRVSESVVRSIFDDLTYANKDISHPDPALQPLIKLNPEVYGIMPHLWFCCSAERNLMALFNKLSSEKAIYAKLVDQKEELMRGRFFSGVSDKGFRLICGNVSGLPDIDLAIIMDDEKACLLLELKWFIDPAEPREIMEKSEEIAKGISQVRQLKQAFANNHQPLLNKLKIDSSYRLEGVVVSENWIGHAQVQTPEIPVIQVDHLFEKLKATESLGSAMEWLKNRKYLPKEGEHFTAPKANTTIGNWTLKWYGIHPLIEDAFFPL